MKNRALNYAFFSQIGGREDFLTLNTFSLDGHIGLTLGLEFLTKEPTLLERFIDIITFLNIYGSRDKDFKDQAKFITTMGPVQTGIYGTMIFFIKEKHGTKTF